jgi:hypothetical protein
MSELATPNLLAGPVLAHVPLVRAGQPHNRAVLARRWANRMVGPLARVLVTPWAQGAAVTGGLAGVVQISVSAAAIGALPGDRPRSWWFSLPAGWLGRPELMADVFYAGMALWLLSWLALGFGVRAGRWRLRGLWLVTAVWTAPLLLAPVALSTDVYTYLGQGLVAAAGLDPYHYGPAAAPVPMRLLRGMPLAWLSSPSPYGPLFVRITGAIAPLARTHLVSAVVVLRLVELAGLGLIAAALPRLASALGADPRRATWLGVTSPLVLTSFVLSAHNDALMLGLLVCGLAVATGTTRLAGGVSVLVAVALCTSAAMVKAPAAIAVLFLALAWSSRADAPRTRLARLGACAAVCVAVLTAISLACGMGWGWLNPATLSSPSRATTPFTPATAITKAVVGLTRPLGLALTREQVMPIVLGLTGALALAFIVGLLARHHRVGVARALGLSLLTAVLASPVTWPWYLCWAVVLLGAATPTRRILGLIVLATAPLLLIEADGTAPPLDMAATTLLATASLAAAGYTLRWSLHNLGNKSAASPKAVAATAAQTPPPRP